VRWVKHNGHTHSTSNWTLENRMFWFAKSEHPVCQMGASSLVCNNYNSTFGCSSSKIRCSSFYRLVLNSYLGAGGASIKAFPLPPLEAAGTTNEPNAFPCLSELLPTPLCEVCMICEKSKLGLSEILFVSTWALWHLLLLEVKPSRWLGIALELPRLWWTMEKFLKDCFSSARKEARA
jgi:hypothetical protein